MNNEKWSSACTQYSQLLDDKLWIHFAWPNNHKAMPTTALLHFSGENPESLPQANKQQLFLEARPVGIALWQVRYTSRPNTSTIYSWEALEGQCVQPAFQMM